MPRFEVEVDGKRFILEGDNPPTESEARSAVGVTPSTPDIRPQDIIRTIGKIPLRAPLEADQRFKANLAQGDPLGIRPRLARGLERTPQLAIETALPIAGGVLGGLGGGGVLGLSAGAGAGELVARAIGIAREDEGDPITFDGFSQSAKEVLGAGAATVAGTLVFAGGLSLAGKAIGKASRFMALAKGRQQREFQKQRDVLVQGFRQRQRQAGIKRDETLKVARNQTAVALQTVSKQTRDRVATLTAEQETLHRTMQEVAEQSVLKVRDTFGAVAKSTSETYQSLVDDALKGLGDVEVPFDQVLRAVQKRMSSEPELFSLAMKQLGVSDEMASLLQQFGPERIGGVSRGLGITVKNVMDRIQKLRRGISKPARQGRQSYTFQEKVTDDTADALTEVLQNMGIEALEKASAFWAQWAPIRDQAFRVFRPFLRTQTETATGISQLLRVTAGKDPGNVRFIQDLEKRLGVPLTKELKGLAQRLTTTQKEKLIARTNQELQTGTLRKVSQKAVDDAKETFSKTMSSIGQAEQGAMSKLIGQQIPAQEALTLKLGAAKFGFHVASVVLLYQILRRGFDAVLQAISPQN